MSKPSEGAKHITKNGSREHVLSWDTHGVHCSEPECEVNKGRKRKETNERKP